MARIADLLPRTLGGRIFLLTGTLVAGLWVVGALSVAGWAWAALGFLVLFNLQFLSLAILGEYIVRTHRHTQRVLELATARAV